ncbi:Response regulator [Azospirillaceae bacterium]
MFNMSERLRFLPSLGIYGGMVVLLLSFAIWLAVDLTDGRARIVSERLALAAQKSQFMSQWFGTTIISADYVLLDINGKITPADLSAHANEPKYFEKLNGWLNEKLATIPRVTGIGIYDENCVFRAAADPQIVGFRSNQKSCQDLSVRLDERVYIQYVPAQKSANKQPAILVSRHHLSVDGKLLGGALIAINLVNAQEWITSFSIDPKDVLAIIDNEGTLLARNPTLPVAIGARTAPPDESRRFSESRFTTSFTAKSPLDGRERFYGLSKIEGVPLVVMVGYDLERSLAEWWRRVWQISVGFLTLLVVSALALRAHMIAVRQREELRVLATTDPLTGVANRRQLVLAGENEIIRAHRYGKQMSLIMVDIDHFKSVNDTWGHPTGDRAIRALAEGMRATTRMQDVVGRLGGEEFAAILSETDRRGAYTKAECLRTTIESTIVKSDSDQNVQFTISVGIATLSSEDRRFENLLGRADKALYAAKAGGRNQVVIE